MEKKKRGKGDFCSSYYCTVRRVKEEEKEEDGKEGETSTPWATESAAFPPPPPPPPTRKESDRSNSSSNTERESSNSHHLLLLFSPFVARKTSLFHHHHRWSGSFLLLLQIKSLTAAAAFFLFSSLFAPSLVFLLLSFCALLCFYLTCFLSPLLPLLPPENFLPLSVSSLPPFPRPSHEKIREILPFFPLAFAEPACSPKHPDTKFAQKKVLSNIYFAKKP